MSVDLGVLEVKRDHMDCHEDMLIHHDGVEGRSAFHSDAAVIRRSDFRCVKVLRCVTLCQKSHLEVVAVRDRYCHVAPVLRNHLRLSKTVVLVTLLLSLP